MAEECNTHGQVRSIVIPRGNHEAGGSQGNNDESVGMVFVHFDSSTSAMKAQKAVAGRSFNGNTVVATFYPESLFTRYIHDNELLSELLSELLNE